MKATEDSKNHSLIAEKVCGWSFRSNVWTSRNGIESYLEHPFLDARQREEAIEAARLNGWHIYLVTNSGGYTVTASGSLFESELCDDGPHPTKAEAEFYALLWVAKHIN